MGNKKVYVVNADLKTLIVKEHLVHPFEDGLSSLLSSYGNSLWTATGQKVKADILEFDELEPTNVFFSKPLTAYSSSEWDKISRLKEGLELVELLKRK